MVIIDGQQAPPRTICVVGLGYIGLPTAACLAEVGFDVIGFDINVAAVERINAGEPHIVEPGLELCLKQVLAAGRLRAVSQPEQADAFLIAVPTPCGDDQYRTPDLSYVESAAASIAPLLRANDLVVLESTSPVGTTDRLMKQLRRERPDLDGSEGFQVDVAYSPERVIPGKTMLELRSNDRVVGGITPEAARRAAAIYSRITSGHIHQTNARTAELVKLAENASRDVSIAFANELSIICDTQDINVWEVIELANHHPRVNILRPGPGVGGHCIAVDPWFIVAQNPEEARLIRTAREINDSKPKWVLQKVNLWLEENQNAKVACLGLSFKPDVDDFRESPSLQIAEELERRHPGRVLATDPFAEAIVGRTSLQLVDLSQALQLAELVLVLVAHHPYRGLVLREGTVVIDAPGLWEGRSPSH